MLKIEDLNVSYDRKIFDNAEAIFYDGNIHGIIGASGCGKTTLIHAILNHKKQCQLIYNDQKIEEDKGQFVLNHIFYVDQYGGYFENMNIFNHFQFYAELMNKSVTETMVNTMLSKVGLKNLNIKHSPSRLSIGERKRFLIALALFSERDIIILDEPTASLDKKNIHLLKELLSSLKDKTIILTTHEGDMLEICNIVYKIENYQIHVENKDIKEVTLKENKGNNKFNIIRYLKYKNVFQWLQQIFLIFIGVFLCIELGAALNDEYALYNGFQDKSYLTNEQMIYFRKKQQNAPNNMYVSGESFNSVKLSSEEKEKIEKISGLISIKNIGTLSAVNPNNTLLSHSFKIIKEGKEKTINEDTVKVMKPVVRPYYPENNMDKDNKKIFITDQFALEHQIQEGDSIKIPLYIPTYQYVYQEESQMYRYISYKNVEMTFTIDKIVASEEGYKSFDTPYIIYIPYQQYEDILNQYNGVQSGDIPRSQNVTGMPYSFDDYVIFSNTNSVESVYQTLTEMDVDYDVFSQAIFYAESSSEEMKLQESKILIIGGIGFVSAIAYLSIYYFQLRSKRGERLQLSYNGITCHEMKKSLFIETAIHVVCWFVISILIIVIFGSQYILLNIGIFMGVSLILALLEGLAICLTIRKEEKKILC